MKVQWRLMYYKNKHNIFERLVEKGRKEMMNYFYSWEKRILGQKSSKRKDF